MTTQDSKKPQVCKGITNFFNRHLYDFQRITSDSKVLINSIFTLFMSFSIFIFLAGGGQELLFIVFVIKRFLLSPS